VSLRSETIEESACSRNALLLMNQRAQAAKLSNLAKERKSFAAQMFLMTLLVVFCVACICSCVA